MSNIGIYPGTFDPITYGHIDVIKRSLKIVNNLVIAISSDNSKNCLFSADERIELINNSLLSSIEYLYPCPVEIKNPYTNIPFLKSTLYNIYFIIKNSTFNMPVLYNIYYACNFDLKIFYYDSESLLKDILIKNLVK